jgi:predicted DCC family thiol-disulfide oxidoreductase YuxK
VSTGAQAMLRAGRLVPRWRWLARALDQPLGRFVLEPLYRQVAAHRRLVTRLLGLPETCAVPGSPPMAKGSATKVERT